ncbi:carboxypeptidase regulatory-like domain-containing protein [Candidatus Poribacteria bacterium]|nr:carboxypeptidase regulatory-like domain-containing protein [Candidatus Poribacteria bacterium]
MKTMNFTFILVLIGTWIWGQASVIAVKSDCSVKGRITDENGNPLPDYVVELRLDDGTSYSVKTDQDGKFMLRNLQEGDWNLHVRFSGMTVQERKLKLVKAEETELDLKVKARGSISGFLLDPVKRSLIPIDGEILLGLLSKWETVERYFKGKVSKGKFEVNGLLPGRYVVIERFSGYVFDGDEAPKVEVSPDANIGGVEIFLRKGVLIRGKVIDEEGKPIPEAKVKLGSSELRSVRPVLRFRRETSTGENGEFLITVPGDPEKFNSFAVMVSRPGYQGELIKRKLERGKNEYHVDITLKRTLIMTGRVIGLKGKSALGLKVVLKMHIKPVKFFRYAAQTELTAYTDSNGEFVFAELYPTEYTLIVYRDNTAIAFLESLNPKDQPHIEVKLGKSQLLKGQVIDDSGHPLPDAKVAATMRPRTPEAHGAQLATCQTDSDGTFSVEILRVDPSLLTVTVFKKGYLSKVYRGMAIKHKDLKVVLQKGRTITGHVFMPPDISIKGSYIVKLFPENTPMKPIINPFSLYKPILSTRLDIEKGAFRIDGIPAGGYQIYVLGEGISATGIDLEVTSENQSVDIFVERKSAKLRGHVLWANTRKPVSGALVSRSWYPWELEPYDLSSMVMSRFETKTDESGYFEFSDLTQGRYIIQISYVKLLPKTGSYEREMIHKRFDVPECGEYVFYLSSKDDKSLLAAQSPSLRSTKP